MASIPRTHGPPELVQRSNITSPTGTNDPGCHATAVQLLRTNVAFVPHVAVWFAGIRHTITLPLTSAISSRDVHQPYYDRYNNERLVKVFGGSPFVKKIA
ncbi:Protein arg-6, partial [Colletotrichum gloeosporioides]